MYLNQEESSKSRNFEDISTIDELIFVEYDDGVFRWVNSQEYEKLNAQDKQTLDFLLKVQKATLVCYFSALHVPFSILHVNAASSLKTKHSANLFNNQVCIQKIDSETNCENFQTFGKIYDYRPMSIRNRNKKNKSEIRYVGRKLSNSSNSGSIIVAPGNIVASGNIKKVSVVQTPELLLENSTSTSLIKNKALLNSSRPTTDFSAIKLSTTKDRNVISSNNNFSNFVKLKENNYVKKEILKIAEERNEYLTLTKEILKEKNVKIIIRELESFKANILNIRGGVTIPGFGGIPIPFANKILGWGVQKASDILSNEAKKEAQKENQKENENSKSNRKNLLKLFDIRNPLVLVGLTIVGFSIFRTQGKEKLEELSDNIQEAIGIKKKKSIRNIVTDTTYSFLTFYTKRPLFFLLTIFLIYQRKLFWRILTNKSERGTFTELAFKTIEDQMKELVKAKDLYSKLSERWMDVFYQKSDKLMSRFSDESRSTIKDLKQKISELETIQKEQSQELLEDKLTIQKAEIYFSQCENAHRQTYEQIIEIDKQCRATESQHEEIHKLLSKSNDMLQLPSKEQLEIDRLKDQIKSVRADRKINERISYKEEFQKEINLEKKKKK